MFEYLVNLRKKDMEKKKKKKKEGKAKEKESTHLSLNSINTYGVYTQIDMHVCWPKYFQ